MTVVFSSKARFLILLASSLPSFPFPAAAALASWSYLALGRPRGGPPAQVISDRSQQTAMTTYIQSPPLRLQTGTPAAFRQLCTTDLQCSLTVAEIEGMGEGGKREEKGEGRTFLLVSFSLSLSLSLGYSV